MVYEEFSMKMPVLVALVLLWMLAPLVGASDRVNIVYHLSEPDRAGFVLNNMQNHINGLGGAENVNMILVVHGPAINALDDIEATENVRNGVARLQDQGVQFEMCGNTLEVFNRDLDDLLPGFTAVNQGGVTRIGQLQLQGYVYLRP
jgi:intracellular sulfur oxidation DsrE/DsrF family protein